MNSTQELSNLYPTVADRALYKFNEALSCGTSIVQAYFDALAEAREDIERARNSVNDAEENYWRISNMILSKIKREDKK